MEKRIEQHEMDVATLNGIVVRMQERADHLGEAVAKEHIDELRALVEKIEAAYAKQGEEPAPPATR